MQGTLEHRRRRAQFRATHRGTKEMDFLLGRYATAQPETMDDPELSEFEQFMAIADPELPKWLIEPGTIGDSAFAPLVERIRAFHGAD